MHQKSRHSEKNYQKNDVGQEKWIVKLEHFPRVTRSHDQINNKNKIHGSSVPPHEWEAKSCKKHAAMPYVPATTLVMKN